MEIAGITLSAAVIWLIIMAVLLIIELITMGLTTIWFAAGALVSAIAAALGGGWILQIVLFVVVSLIMLLSLRKISMKSFNKGRTRTNVDSLIGQSGKVMETIDNFNEEGKVVIKGMEWTARSTENVVIPKGTQVTIDQVNGVKLMVHPN